MRTKLTRNIANYERGQSSFAKLLRRESFTRFLHQRPLFVKLIDVYKPEVYGPEGFYRQLFKDVLSARRSEVIEIYSPILSVNAVECMLATLRKTRAKIRVHTLDPRAIADGNKRKEQERSIQILEENIGDKLEIVLRRAMHEKAIIVGNRVCYIGSINLLSMGSEDLHSDYMIKYENPEIVTAFAHFLEVIEESSEKH